MQASFLQIAIFIEHLGEFNQNINPAKMRGYASKCDALLKAGEAIRTPDIHVGNVQVYRLNGIKNTDFERF